MAEDKRAILERYNGIAYEASVVFTDIINAFGNRIGVPEAHNQPINRACARTDAHTCAHA